MVVAPEDGSPDPSFGAGARSPGTGRGMVLPASAAPGQQHGNANKEEKTLTGVIHERLQGRFGGRVCGMVHGFVPVVRLAVPVTSGATTGAALPKMRVTLLPPEFVIQTDPAWSMAMPLGAL